MVVIFCCCLLSGSLLLFGVKNVGNETIYRNDTLSLSVLQWKLLLETDKQKKNEPFKHYAASLFFFIQFTMSCKCWSIFLIDLIPLYFVDFHFFFWRSISFVLFLAISRSAQLNLDWIANVLIYAWQLKFVFKSYFRLWNWWQNIIRATKI